MQLKKNKSIRGLRILSLILIGPVLWLAVLVWSEVAHSQQETRWPTHYVIVVRNTSLNVPGAGELISGSEFRTAIDSIPRGLSAASGQISLWRRPEPGDLISVVFAAAGKDPKPPDQRGCESPHYPDPSVPGRSIPLKLGTYFDVRARIVVEEHDSPFDIANPSSRLHQKLLQSLVLKDCDLIANAYSEGLTLAKGFAAVEIGDANGEENYKQFFLLVFDFASPAYGSTEFNATFDVSHEDLAPGTPAYLIAPIGSLKFADGEWSLELINYLDLDYPAKEPGGTNFIERDKRKFYPRLRFYRAIAHEVYSDPFYNFENAQQETKRLNLQVAQHKQEIDQLEQSKNQLERDLQEARTIAFVAGIAAATFALLMVLVTWQWWAIKGRFRRMAEEYQKELQRTREEQLRLAETQERDLVESRRALAEEFREKQAALETKKEKLKSLLTSTICIPDAPNTEKASESA